jgi:hypothetical protein
MMLEEIDLQTRMIWALQDLARHQRCAFISYNEFARLALGDRAGKIDRWHYMYLFCAFDAEKDFVRSALTLRLMKTGWSYDYAVWFVAAQWSETIKALQELTGVPIIDGSGKFDKRLAAKASLMLEDLSLN